MGTTDQSERWRWVRLGLVLAVAGAVCFPALLLVAWFLFAGGRYGWVTSALAFGALGFVVGWLAIAGRWGRVRRRTSLGLAAVAALAGIAVAHAAPPTPGRLRHEISELAQPGWQLTDDTVEGSAACFDACTSVTRQYAVDAGADDVLAQLAPDLARRGLERMVGSDDDRQEFGERHGGGEIALWVDVVRDGPHATIVYIRADASG